MLHRPVFQGVKRNNGQPRARFQASDYGLKVSFKFLSFPVDRYAQSLEGTSVGRYIGFDIFLKTFLAAVQNPQSVLYTENLRGEVSNAECYYGKVCSSYTSYALQCATWYVSRLHGPPYRDGVTLVEWADRIPEMAGEVTRWGSNPMRANSSR